MFRVHYCYTLLEGGSAVAHFQGWEPLTTEQQRELASDYLRSHVLTEAAANSLAPFTGGLVGSTAAGFYSMEADETRYFVR